MHNDRAILVTALQQAVAKYAEKKKGKTLLGATPPDDEVLEPLSAAIEKCRVYQAVAGHALPPGRRWWGWCQRLTSRPSRIAEGEVPER
jgi:hypothetical protein